MKLSFGMIFSIILIIIFISFSFVAIKKFLTLGDVAQISKFTADLQNDINRAWKGSQSSQEKEYRLPTKIEFICFANYSNYPSGERREYKEYFSELKQFHQEYENLFFYPVGSSEGSNSKEIKNINLNEIVKRDNPFCIKNDKGKITLRIVKQYGEDLVTITK